MTRTGELGGHTIKKNERSLTAVIFISLRIEQGRLVYSEEPMH